MPVSSYAAQLLELFRVASQRRIELKLPTEKAAFALRFRLHNLRKAMHKENHELKHIADGVMFRVRETEGGGGLLIAAPADDEFLPELHAAGIKVEAPEEAPPAPATPQTTSKGQAALQRFLDGDKK